MDYDYYNRGGRGRGQRGNHVQRGRGRGVWRNQIDRTPVAGHQRNDFHNYNEVRWNGGSGREQFDISEWQANPPLMSYGRPPQYRFDQTYDFNRIYPNPPASVDPDQFYDPRQLNRSRPQPPPLGSPSEPHLTYNAPAAAHNRTQLNRGRGRGHGQLHSNQQRHHHQERQGPRNNWDNKRGSSVYTRRPTSGTTEKNIEQLSTRGTEDSVFHVESNSMVGHGQDDGTQKERLTETLSSGEYECMVCCERVRQTQPTWNCRNCYNIFHLGCVRKWARASTEEMGWRCPGCQYVTEKVPLDYFCFCGKTKNPEWNHYDVPHGCGNQCGRRRRGTVPQTKEDECLHPCNLLCHPGPCPPCGTYIPRSCNCGKLTQQVRCGHVTFLCCDEICKKLLNCGIHECGIVCHAERCVPCGVKINQKCFCGNGERQISCGAQEVTAVGSASYSCGEVCNGPLDCGNHQCDSICHDKPCKSCELNPDAVTHCPCGLTPIAQLFQGKARTKCTDLIPTCDKICDKELECGPEDGHHKCTSKCHMGACSPCGLKSSAPCRCGNTVRKIDCSKILGVDGTNAITCEKKCNKKKSCGRHKCQNRCCPIGDTEHLCALTCGRRLKCGLHTCDEPCHPGNCQPCWNTSFDELSCHCGATITYPPVPCGTRPPQCNRQCSRRHQCDHPVIHNCHSETQCPPCTYLTEKWCYGRHEKRTCIPCHETAVCCGMLCNKPLPCGRHKCTKICHLGDCVDRGATISCNQPCPEMRVTCGHPCGAPCHGGDCPSKGNCKTQVTVKCKCGQRKGTMACAERSQIHKRLVSVAVASKLRLVNDTVNLSEASQLVNIDTILDCNDECAATERNRRMALALQIRNPDVSNKLSAPAYSDFLKDQAKQNPPFVASIYDKLTDLVQSANTSKQKSRSHAFAPMRSDQRRVIHELAELFGCDTQSYDEEPKKNVVATAYRYKSWLPSVSLVTVVQKESGSSRPAGKAPPPVPHYHVLRSATQQQESQPVTTTMSSTNGSGARGGQRQELLGTIATPNDSEQAIDYFDFVG